MHGLRAKGNKDDLSHVNVALFRARKGNNTCQETQHNMTMPTLTYFFSSCLVCGPSSHALYSTSYPFPLTSNGQHMRVIPGSPNRLYLQFRSTTPTSPVLTQAQQRQDSPMFSWSQNAVEYSEMGPSFASLLFTEA